MLEIVAVLRVHCSIQPYIELKAGLSRPILKNLGFLGFKKHLESLKKLGFLCFLILKSEFLHFHVKLCFS